MKINVITRHSIVNYGSYFQTIATQNFFEENGYECNIIDYISKDETILGNIKVNSRKRKGIKKILYPLLKFPDEFLKTKKFYKFTRKNMNLTKRFSSHKDLKGYTFSDLLCSGSDQLWGYMPNGKIDDAYLLNFKKEQNKCISFASSFGRTDFKEEEWNHIGNELKKYSVISLREAALVNKINHDYSLKSFSILDPTLMVKPEFWFGQCSKVKRVIKNKYILVYQLRSNSNMDNYIELVSHKLNLKVIRISTQVYDIFKKNTLVLKKPEIVLSIFKDADLVITDSFHATILSIIFNKQFIDVLPPNTSLRIVDLLNTLNLNGQIIKSYDDFDMLNNKIEYELVNDKLEKLRIKYKNEYLKQLEDLQ